MTKQKKQMAQLKAAAFEKQEDTAVQATPPKRRKSTSPIQFFQAPDFGTMAQSRAGSEVSQISEPPAFMLQPK